jgi:hypothetical protein
MPDVVAPWISPEGKYRAVRLPCYRNNQDWGGIIDTSKPGAVCIAMTPTPDEAIEIVAKWNHDGAPGVDAVSVAAIEAAPHKRIYFPFAIRR